VRNRQEGRKLADEKALQAAKKNAKKSAKTKPADAQNSETAGTKTNP
jgi:hypothetical protein